MNDRYREVNLLDASSAFGAAADQTLLPFTRCGANILIGQNLPDSNRPTPVVRWLRTSAISGRRCRIICYGRSVHLRARALLKRGGHSACEFREPGHGAPASLGGQHQ